MENNLKLLRKKKGLSQTELAELAETSRQNIYEIEIGNRNPGIKTALKISKVLKCSVEDIFLTNK